MKLGLYWKYATRSLIRSGQRTVLAIFCIAVGVMAIVALQLVGISINQALTANVVAANGGDIHVSAISAPLRQSDLDVVTQLKQAGKITEYATAYGVPSQITLDSGEIVNPDLIGVSSNFPLVDDANYIKPSSDLHTKDLLQGNNVVIDSSTFDALKAHVGDTLQVKTQDDRLVPVKIAGVYTAGNGFGNGTIYMSATALSAVPNVQGKPVPVSYTGFYLTVPSANVTSVKNTLTEQIPAATVRSAQDLLKQRQDQVNQIRLFLQIVGLLALFIGGIGIINTMQVLLRRRRVEIAMLKTTGYSQRDLYGFFGLEAALLGLAGGLVGTLLALGASGIVRTVVEKAFQVNLPVVLDTFTLSYGILIGLFTALIFGILPIVQASQIRPLSVLRESEDGTGRSSWLLSSVLLALLMALFIGLAWSIIGDLLKATFIVLGGTAILFAMAAGFGLLVVAISKLPIYEKPSPRILLWILAAFGIVIGAGVAFGILSASGFGLTLLGANVGGTVGSILSYGQIVLTGFGVVLLGGAGVFFLATIIDAIVMFTPRTWKTAVMLAYRNMGRQRIRTTITLTALFVGVFAIGVVLLVGQGVKDAINNILTNSLQYNVFVLAPDSEHTALASQVPNLPGLQAGKYTDNPVAANLSVVSINGVDIKTVLTNDPLKEFRNKDHIGTQGIVTYLSAVQGYYLDSGKASDLPDKSAIVKGQNLQPSDAGTNNVVLPNDLELPPLNMKIGDTFIVQNLQGQSETLHVVGFWNTQSLSSATAFATVFADAKLTQTLGGDQTLDVYSLKVDPSKEIALRKELNHQVPTAQVVSIADLSAIIDQVLNGLISMLTTIASLALIAALIIIANAVALAMLERRREIGILKSVGHTSGSVLATVLIENGLVGALGALVAMLLVGTLLGVLTLASHINFGFNLPIIALIVGSSAIVTMIISALVAWTATRVRPIEVLRYE